MLPSVHPLPQCEEASAAMTGKGLMARVLSGEAVFDPICPYRRTIAIHGPNMLPRARMANSGTLQVKPMPSRNALAPPPDSRRLAFRPPPTRWRRKRMAPSTEVRAQVRKLCARHNFPRLVPRPFRA
jgi:hypothetical protein